MASDLVTEPPFANWFIMAINTTGGLKKDKHIKEVWRGVVLAVG